LAFRFSFKVLAGFFLTFFLVTLPFAMICFLPKFDDHILGRAAATLQLDIDYHTLPSIFPHRDAGLQM
jgi:hypothetical protein